jgi:hypothetical protein
MKKSAPEGAAMSAALFEYSCGTAVISTAQDSPCWYFSGLESG